jgi:hypothetical protein
MAVGLRIPVGVNKEGGAALEDSDANNDKIIKIALGDGDSDNAFQQDLALDEDMIFNIADPVEQAAIVTKLIRIFENFENIEKRFHLLVNTIEWDDSELKKGNMILKFRYVNLESDEEKPFEQRFGAGA